MSNKEKTETLKPCPFCDDGGMAYSYKDRYGGQWGKCKYCGAEKPLDEWNNRPDEDRLKAEIERLKAENDSIKTGHAYLSAAYALTEKHPTCETCGNNDNRGCSIGNVGCNYCSAHTALTENGEDDD